MAQIVLKKGDKLKPRAAPLGDLDILDVRPGRVLLNFKDKGKDCGGGWFNIEDVLTYYEKEEHAKDKTQASKRK